MNLSLSDVLETPAEYVFFKRSFDYLNSSYVLTFLGALVLSIHSTDRKYLEAEIFFFEMELANLTAIVRDRKQITLSA